MSRIYTKIYYNHQKNRNTVRITIMIDNDSLIISYMIYDKNNLESTSACTHHPTPNPNSPHKIHQSTSKYTQSHFLAETLAASSFPSGDSVTAATEAPSQKDWGPCQSQDLLEASFIPTKALDSIRQCNLHRIFSATGRSWDQPRSRHFHFKQLLHWKTLIIMHRLF